ncbi:hypothetical protein VNO77_22633 [Canavalia gladiata]|uniref:Uncharacterized protein n=1 Tax=Canavalia gladiata TaxID=3824 RepID=A0AAN9L6E4_CANGL
MGRPAPGWVHSVQKTTYLGFEPWSWGVHKRESEPCVLLLQRRFASPSRSLKTPIKNSPIYSPVFSSPNPRRRFDLALMASL